MFGAKESFCSLYRKPLNLINDFVSLVVALSWVSLAVLIDQHCAIGFQN